MSFPDCLDNTILSSAKRCMMQARYAYIEDLRAPGESVHLHFGGAFAYGLETARRKFHDEGFSAEQAVNLGVVNAQAMYGDFDPPFKSPKTRAACGNAVRYYFSVWPLDSDPVQPIRLPDGNLGVEWRFKVPLPGLVHPDHGGPLYLVGRTDMLPTLHGMTIIEDDKTATQLGEKWASQWQLDSQFLGYVWAAQQEGILPANVPGTALIRGIGIYTPKYVKPGTSTPVKATGEKLAAMVESGEVVYSLMDSFGHAQEIVNHTPWMVQRWLHETRKIIGRLIHAYLNDPDATKGEWDMALDKAACGAYGGCSYTNLCMSQNPEEWKAVNFVKRRWDPLATV